MRGRTAKNFHKSSVGEDGHERGAEGADEQQKRLEDEAEDDRQDFVDHVPEDVRDGGGDGQEGGRQRLHAVEERREANLRQQRVGARLGQAARRLGAHGERCVALDGVGVARRANGLGEESRVAAELRRRLVLRRDLDALADAHVPLEGEGGFVQHPVVRVAAEREHHHLDHDKDCGLHDKHREPVVQGQEDYNDLSE